jgi:hypothetical protein
MTVTRRRAKEDEMGRLRFVVTTAIRLPAAMGAVAVAAAAFPALAYGGALEVISPASVTRFSQTGDATFGPLSFDVTGDVVIAEDASDASGPSSTDACSPLANPAAVAARIALVDRGTCAFTVKVKNAQDAGALAVIVADIVDGPVAGMGGSDPAIAIPSARITRALGAQIKTALVDGPVRVRFATDTTPPFFTYLPETIVVIAESPAGAWATFPYVLADDNFSLPYLTCTREGQSFYPIGTTTVTCTATDVAGNTATASFDVIVKGAPQQIDDVIATVDALNARSGIVNSLDAKLQAIQSALGAVNAGDNPNACNKLDAFSNEVRAQAGHGLSSTDADRLIADAQRINAVIGCP